MNNTSTQYYPNHICISPIVAVSYMYILFFFVFFLDALHQDRRKIKSDPMTTEPHSNQHHIILGMCTLIQLIKICFVLRIESLVSCRSLIPFFWFYSRVVELFNTHSQRSEAVYIYHTSLAYGSKEFIHVCVCVSVRELASTTCCCFFIRLLRMYCYKLWMSHCLCVLFFTSIRRTSLHIFVVFRIRQAWMRSYIAHESLVTSPCIFRDHGRDKGFYSSYPIPWKNTLEYPTEK